MVNTRILEQRLGWRSGKDDEDVIPPHRINAQAPVLQGRINRGTRGMALRGPRRAVVDEAWSRLPEIDDTLEHLMGQNRGLPQIDRTSPMGVAMDRLRSQIMRVMRENGWRRIGITSPHRRAGRTLVSTGLAASFTRLDATRTLLIDADLEAPGIADMLRIEANCVLESVLLGDVEPLDKLQRLDDSLALALNDAPIAAAGDLMLSTEASLAIRGMIDGLEPDVVIFDLPPLLDDTTTQALLPEVDAVLLVSDGLKTTAKDVLECERLLKDQVPLLGIILNKSEDREARASSTRRKA